MHRLLSLGRFSGLVALMVIVSLGNSTALYAQTRALITVPVDEAKLTTLKNGGQARLRGAKDLGAVDVSKPAGRMMLVLKRSDERERSLQSYLTQVHQTGSDQFHKWLTPEAFAQRYGAADSDIKQVSDWLTMHGMKVAGVSAGKGTIEFRGNIGQVNEAFHTSIHQFSMKGETHIANTREPQIPTALAAAVAGVSQLNDFHPKPTIKVAGRALYNPKTHNVKPQWTYGEGQGNPPFYFLTPEDFATQYDAKASYAAGTTGAGQTIGIVNDSNIDISLVNAYRKIFGLGANPPQVVIDGNDPGINGDAVEAYLDVENAGAIAPGATVKLYIAGNEGLLGDGGLTFSMLRAVNDDAASVLSLSFGTCEENGTAYNQFINGLWEQAAAQGQTVLVSTGDSGSFGCYGIGVNGFASTPWDIAVGGTDAYFTDYATGGASISTLWSDTNDANQGSLQKKMTEQAWNGTQFGFNSITYDPVADQPQNRGSGGGGVSVCAVGADSFDPNTGLPVCISGYPKPTWQIGAGVPNDGVRDLPDVALFASNGYNGVTWPLCSEAGDCTETNTDSGELYVGGVGGTSASAPAMAGIMALVNQKYGAQGQANFTLYALAAQYPATFNDITFGSNNEPCPSYGVGLLIGCALDKTDSYYSYQDYYTRIGYDNATGLGTVDVDQLLTDWSKVSFKSSGTTLSLTPTTITHGQMVTVSAAVTGTGTPAGVVGLVTSSSLPNNRGVTALELADGKATEMLSSLPGGTYAVVGQYSGDGINAASTSAPVTMTVNPEASTVAFAPIYLDPNNFNIVPITANASVPYGSEVLLDVQIEDATGTINGNPTGTVTFNDGSTPLRTQPVSAGGTAEYNGNYLTVGTHTINGSYSGDASYRPGTFGPVTFNVEKSTVGFILLPDFGGIYTDSGAVQYQAGQSATVEALVSTSIQAGLYPTGTVTFQLGSAMPVTVPLVPTQNLLLATGSIASSVLSDLQVGSYTLTFTYNGDANYSPHTGTQTVLVVPSTLLNSTSTLLVASPSSLTDIPAGTVVKLQGIVSGAGTIAPTGTVTFTVGNLLNFSPVDIIPGTGNASTVTFTFRAADLLGGNNTISMDYSGDIVYASSASNTLTVSDDSTDFTLQSQTPNLTIAAGSTGTATVNLIPLNGFSGPVTLACAAPTSMTCSTSVASIAVGGAAVTTATLTVKAATTKATTMSNADGGKNWPWTRGGGVSVGMLLICLLPKRRRLGRLLLSVMAMSVLFGVLGCGNNNAPPPPAASANTPLGTYSVIVTGMAPNGLVHNALITVIVQ